MLFLVGIPCCGLSSSVYDWVQLCSAVHDHGSFGLHRGADHTRELESWIWPHRSDFLDLPWVSGMLCDLGLLLFVLILPLIRIIVV